MAKKKQIGILGAVAMSLATAIGGAQQVNVVPESNQTTIEQQSKKDALPVVKQQIRMQYEKNRFGGFSGLQNPYKHAHKDGRNQRQWRKWLRSNPSMRRSKHGK